MFSLSRPLLAFRFSLALGGLALAASASAQGSWPKADCAALNALGSPQPAWLSAGANAPATESLLTMLNYQMALSICQQEEIARLLKANASAAQSQALALERSLSKTRLSEAPKESLPSLRPPSSPGLPALLPPLPKGLNPALAPAKSPLTDLCSAALGTSSCPAMAPGL